MPKSLTGRQPRRPFGWRISDENFDRWGSSRFILRGAQHEKDHSDGRCARGRAQPSRHLPPLPSPRATVASPTPTGTIRTYSDNGPIDTRGAFFQSLGTNGRTCATCHVVGEAMSLSAAGARRRFALTRGDGPPVWGLDGANCPNGRRENPTDHSLLLKSGLFRIALTPPANAQFAVSLVQDPYGCAITPDGSGQPVVSVYRRPLPATNLRFLSAIMWDGRETLAPLNSSTSLSDNLVTDLTDQANSAINGHAQAAQPATPAQLADIVNFELGLYTAQETDLLAGNLAGGEATGGAYNVYSYSSQYYPGVNDPLGGDPAGDAFNPVSMTLFSSWRHLSYADVRRPEDWVRITARRAIAAGETLFNTAPHQHHQRPRPQR